MYAWAVESLPLALASRLIFICLEEHLRERRLEQDIRARYANFTPIIIALSEVTEGQACTVLAARERIDAATPLLIYNADTYCRTAIGELLQHEKRIDGVIGIFQAPGDKWSFARVNGAGRVVETAEKRRISEWATTGLYHFTRGSDFVRYAEAMIAANERVNGEFYVAPIYNRMIADGLNIRIDKAPEVWVLGTPEDLAHFEQNYRANWDQADNRVRCSTFSIVPEAEPP